MKPTHFWETLLRGGNARRAVALQLIIMFLLGFCIRALHAQPAERQGSPWQLEYDLFQMLLEEKGLEILSDYSSAIRQPKSSVIVLMGAIPRELSGDDWDSLYKFVESGGAALITSDSAYNSERFGTFFSRSVSSTDYGLQYQGFEDCLVVPTTEEGMRRMPGVDALVTNRSGWFEPELVNEIFWESLASFPDGCAPPRAQGQSLVTMGTINERGRVIVSSDASLFSNGMMWHGDNAVASIRIAELLCEGGRNQLAFVKNSRFSSSYKERITAKPDPEIPLPDQPEPTLDKMLRLSNAVVKEVAESNVLNEALRDQPRHWTANNYFLLLLNLAVIAFLIFLAALLWRSGTLANRFLPRKQMKTAYQLRCETGGRKGDYRNAAGYLAREFCWEVTGSRKSNDWQVSVQRFTHLSKQARRQLDDIVDIASRGRQMRMNRDEFERLGTNILELSNTLLPDRTA